MRKRKPPKRKRKHAGFEQVYDGLNMGWIPVWTKDRETPTPANMPSELSILGQKYRVRYRPEIYSAPKKSAALDGVVIFSHRLILIDPRLSIHDMRQTLYHEACHVYLKESAMKDSRLQKLTEAEIEGICDMFGGSVYDLAINNSLPKA